MTVNIISESVFFQAQGVHTAFLTNIRLARRKGLDVRINSLLPADITHIHTFFPYGYFKLLTAKHSVVTAHLTPESLLGSLKGDKLMHAAAKRYLPYFYNHADLLLAVSSMVRDDVKALGVKTKIEVFPNPVDTDAFTPHPSLREAGRTRIKIPQDAFVFVGCGQVQSRKGISDFIKLAERIPEALFVWIGSSPFKGLTAIDKEMDALLNNPPKNFLLRGPFGYDTMPELFNAGDVFFFPSLQETSGMVILESAACGLPLILRDLIPYKTLFADAYHPCTTLDDFEKEARRLLTDKGYYVKRQKESLEMVKKYSIDTLGDSLIRYYESLL